MLYKSNSEKKWFTDQLITTWALLSTKICSVPDRSNLWEMPELKFDPTLDDSKKCFHGVFEDCNIRRTQLSLGRKCQWWHFYPNEGFQNHLDKFYELTNNAITLDQEIIL